MTDPTGLLARIRDAARNATDEQAPTIVAALAARVTDGSLAEATPSMSTALAQAEDDLAHGHPTTTLLGIAYMASVALEVQQVGALDEVPA